MYPVAKPKPSVQTGHPQIDALAAKRGWHAADAGAEVRFTRSGAQTVTVTKRLLDRPVIQDRIARQLETL
jgi:hypothetical protein